MTASGLCHLNVQEAVIDMDMIMICHNLSMTKSDPLKQINLTCKIERERERKVFNAVQTTMVLFTARISEEKEQI